MGSKKSKDKDRERKKRKRDTSTSRSRDRHHGHKHRKHKKQHKRAREERTPSLSLSDISLSDNEREYKRDSPDIYERPPPVAIVPPSPPIPPIIKHAKRNVPPMPTPPLPPVISKPTPPSPPSISNNQEQLSLSVEETNKLREKLGLKPLVVDAPPKNEATNVEEKKMDFVHKPAENLADKLHVERLREKIALQREKRLLKAKVSHLKKLGDSDEDEDSSLAWVHKSRKKEKEKKEAEKKNKMLEELDAQFGIGDLVEEEITQQKKIMYSGASLKGMTVLHDITRFDDDRTTILTLKDSNVLEGEDDTLVNVNLIDEERAEKNVHIRRTKLDDVEYEAPEMDKHGNLIQSNILKKYDEEIDGEKRKSFKLGNLGFAVPEEDNKAKNAVKLRKLQTLTTPETQLATEYMTEAEAVQFKKVKKKKKKKKFTADDLEPIQDGEMHHASRKQRHVAASVMGNVTQPNRVKSLRELLKEDESEIKMEVDKSVGNSNVNEIVSDDEPDDIELQEALARSRRAKLAVKKQFTAPSPPHIDGIKTANFTTTNNTTNSSDSDDESNITLNLTDEFCRTLGDIPTYGMAGNRADDESTAIQQAENPGSEDPIEMRGAWEEVDIEDTKVEISDEINVPILEEEPDTGKGVANALRLAMKKGYLEKDASNKAANATLQHLRAIHYSIEDKTAEDDRRARGGDRYSGPTQDFREKNGYKPEVKLEYVDDEGRKLNAKEAFRYLSHKFHGKGSGKNKLEKRMKKWEEELLMKHMSSSDTPLQTLERQRDKQKTMGTAYLVLSGSKTQEVLDVKK